MLKLKGILMWSRIQILILMRIWGRIRTPKIELSIVDDTGTVSLRV